MRLPGEGENHLVDDATIITVTRIHGDEFGHLSHVVAGRCP